MGSLRYFGILCFVAVVCVVTMFGYAAKAGDRTDSDITPQQLLSLMPKDRYLGDVNAPVVIVEYASFTCSHCADFAAKVFPLLKSEYIDTGKVLYIYRDFPLDKLSLTAAMLGSCYRDNKTFFAYVRAVFGAFDTLIATYKDLGLLTNIAKISNISDEEFKKCTTDESLMDDIVQQKFLAVSKLDVNATPVFFINGRKYESAHTFDVMSEEIERELVSRPSN